MKIKCLVVGSLDVNCYIVYGEDGTGVVIDPGGDAGRIMEYIKSENISVKAVLNTHGHSDHIGANDEIRDATGAPLYIHGADAPMLQDPRLNLSAFMGYKVTSRPAEHLLRDGDRLTFGEINLQVMHTPGHSPGGVCFAEEGFCFTGDTLFAGSIGRTDFPGSSEPLLAKSIRERVMTLTDDTEFYSGHGSASTIGFERVHNPFVRWFMRDG